MRIDVSECAINDTPQKAQETAELEWNRAAAALASQPQAAAAAVPQDVPTVGVERTQTVGKNDTPATSAGEAARRMTRPETIKLAREIIRHLGVIDAAIDEAIACMEADAPPAPAAVPTAVPADAANYAQLYGMACEAIDHAGFRISMDKATGVLNLVPKNPQPASQGVDLGRLWVGVKERLPTEEDYGEHEDVLVIYRYTDRPYVQWLIGDSTYIPTDEPVWNEGWRFGSCDYAEVSHWARKDDLLRLVAQHQKESGDE